jgi:hypothetical protein
MTRKRDTARAEIVAPHPFEPSGQFDEHKQYEPCTTCGTYEHHRIHTVNPENQP